MKQMWIVLAWATVLIVGCVRSELQEQGDRIAQGKARVELVFQTAPSPIIYSKAEEQTVNEKAIANLWLFVFGSDTKLKEVHQVAVINNNTVSVELSVGKGLSLYAFANVTSYMEEQLKKLTKGTSTFANLRTVLGDLSSVRGALLPMWGELSNIEINSSSPLRTMLMTRSCARFDAVATGVPDFTLQGIVKVIGAAQTSTIYPASKVVAATSPVSYAPITIPAVSAYAYENAITDISKAMNLVVKGVYKGIEGYYKLRVQWDGTNYTVKRNVIYSFVITKVNAPGFATLAEAEANEPQNIDYDTKVTDPQLHDLMVSNGQYYLGMTNSEYVAYADGDLTNTVLTTLKHNANAALVTTAGTIQAVDVMPAGSFTLATTSIPVGTSTLDIIGTLNQEFKSATVKIRLGNLYQELKVRRKAILPSNEDVLSDFSGSEYVVVENTQAATKNWLLLGVTASSCSSVLKVNNPAGGVYVAVSNNTGAVRRSTLYVGRSANGGRVKAYIEQAFTK